MIDKTRNVRRLLVIVCTLMVCSVEELKRKAQATLQGSWRRPLMIQVKEWSG
jgi:hypothetical protein